MRTRDSATVPFVLFLAALAAGGCASKRVDPADLQRPRRVMVVTIAREPAPPMVVRPGLSLGVMLGSLGSGVSGGISMDAERDASRKPAVDFGAWDFRSELQRIVLSSVPAPGGWTWVDGDRAEREVLDEILTRTRKPRTRTPRLAAYAAREGIDRVLVIEPTAWGYQRDAGFRADLRGRLYEADDKPRLLWEGRAKSRRASGRDRSDVSEPRRRLLESAAGGATALVAQLSEGDR